MKILPFLWWFSLSYDLYSPGVHIVYQENVFSNHKSIIMFTGRFLCVIFYMFCKCSFYHHHQITFENLSSLISSTWFVCNVWNGKYCKSDLIYNLYERMFKTCYLWFVSVSDNRIVVFSLTSGLTLWARSSSLRFCEGSKFSPRDFVFNF